MRVIKIEKLWPKKTRNFLQIGYGFIDILYIIIHDSKAFLKLLRQVDFWQTLCLNFFFLSQHQIETISKSISTSFV